MKTTTKQLISKEMSRISKAMSKEQRVRNGQKAWQTRIANLERKGK